MTVKSDIFKRILISGIIVIGASLNAPALQPVAPVWTETEMQNAWCYALGAQGVNCLPRVDLTALPPTPIVTPTRTAQPPTATPAAPVLTNGDFESGTLGWQTVNASGQAAGEVYHDVFHDGSTSLMFIDHFRCWRRGVYQTVTVMPLARYKFSAWGRTWAGSTQGLDLTKPSDTSVNDWLAMGIDANGGTDYTASAVNWSQNTATERWAQASVISTALGSQMTVYVLLNMGVSGSPGQPGAACEWALPTLAGWLDEAALEIAP